MSLIRKFLTSQKNTSSPNNHKDCDIDSSKEEEILAWTKLLYFVAQNFVRVLRTFLESSMHVYMCAANNHHVAFI